jgi:antitoxin ParD1/3/4
MASVKKRRCRNGATAIFRVGAIKTAYRHLLHALAVVGLPSAPKGTCKAIQNFFAHPELLRSTAEAAVQGPLAGLSFARRKLGHVAPLHRPSNGRASPTKYDMFILMNTMERITITLTPEMAQTVRGAVEAGEYASSSEIIREALRDWRHKRALQAQELADLRAAVQEGLDDIEAGRVRDFDAERIIRQGEERLQRRAASSD